MTPIISFRAKIVHDCVGYAAYKLKGLQSVRMPYGSEERGTKREVEISLIYWTIRKRRRQMFLLSYIRLKSRCEQLCWIRWLTWGGETVRGGKTGTFTSVGSAELTKPSEPSNTSYCAPSRVKTASGCKHMWLPLRFCLKMCSQAWFQFS